MARKKDPSNDGTVTKVLEKAFSSLPFTQQVLAVAEASVGAATTLPGSTVKRGKEAVKAIGGDVSKAYRGKKLMAMTKHKNETELAVAVSLKLLQKKHGLTIEEAADVLGISAKDAKRITGKKAVRAALSSPAALKKALAAPTKKASAKKKPSKKKAPKKKKAARASGRKGTKTTAPLAPAAA